MATHQIIDHSLVASTVTTKSEVTSSRQIAKRAHPRTASRSAYPFSSSLLSRRRVSGNEPQFTEVFAKWSSNQDDSPCVAFDVTWKDDTLVYENHLHGYGIRVEVTDSTNVGELVLVLLPNEEWSLAEVERGSKFRDVISRQLVTICELVGVVVEEREFMTNDQRAERNQKPQIEDSAENTGLMRALESESSDEMPLLMCMASLQQSSAFRLIGESYGKDAKAAAALALENESEDSFDKASDDSFDIRQLCARMFRAGQLAERHVPLHLQK